jgi:hypothetical protein
LTLPIRITERELIVYGPHIEEIARHPLFARQLTGQVQLRAEHQPRDDADKKYEVLQQRYAELGPVASRFLEGLVQHRRYGKDEAQKVLALLETYHRHDLLAALERAVRYGAYSRSAVERILAIQATPKTALDALADQEQQQLKSLLGDTPVRPRSGQDYQKLVDDQTKETPDAHAQPHPATDSDSHPAESGYDGEGDTAAPPRHDDRDDDDDDGSACGVGA